MFGSASDSHQVRQLIGIINKRPASGLASATPNKYYVHFLKVYEKILFGEEVWVCGISMSVVRITLCLV